MQWRLTGHVSVEDRVIVAIENLRAREYLFGPSVREGRYEECR